MAEAAQNKPSSHQNALVRFSSVQRFEHMILLVTFTGLALTGLPQRYADQGWAQALIFVLGGIEGTRIIHRVLATILMAESIFHGGILSYKLYVLGQQASMIPGMRDLNDVVQWVLFNLGLRREHPHLPRYNFGEKAEYLAVVWGTVVMIITGFIMWNPIASAAIMPGQFIPAARAAHSAEALLAVLSILIWHMYNVHIRRFNKSMFTGRLSYEAMEEEHKEELEAIERGEIPEAPPKEIIIRRQLFFIPYAIMVTMILTAALVYFITFEETALTTLAERQVYIETDLDLTNTSIATGEVIWIEAKCAVCHGLIADGGNDPLGVSLLAERLAMEDFIMETRLGPADMPAYPIIDLSDEDMANLWVWYVSLE